MAVSAEIVALIAAAVAVFAAVLAVRATALVAGTVLASQKTQSQDVSATVIDGQTRRDLAADTRDYAFVVRFSNPSGQSRRFDAPTLRVTYRTRANFLGAVDLQSPTPIELTAGQAMDATVRFSTNNVIPRHSRIDAYALLLTDAAGKRLTVDASLPEMLQSDTDGVGSATWGWD